MARSCDRHVLTYSLDQLTDAEYKILADAAIAWATTGRAARTSSTWQRTTSATMPPRRQVVGSPV